MPAVIAAEWGEADALKKSALIAMAMTLFVMTIIINMAATAIVNRSMQRTEGQHERRPTLDARRCRLPTSTPSADGARPRTPS